MTKAKNLGGRPPLPEGHAKGHMLQVRLTDAELDEYREAAKRADKPLSEWIRGHLSRAAKREAAKRG